MNETLKWEIENEINNIIEDLKAPLNQKPEDQSWLQGYLYGLRWVLERERAVVSRR